MIIQRLATALRRQDWFQVTIEILIVVIGIFLGLQVQGWYEDRTNRVLEQNYLVKLHAEAGQLLQDINETTSAVNRINNHLSNLAQKLVENQQDETIHKLECNSLSYSHIYTVSIISLPTLNELISSGQIPLIKNEEIRTLIATFILSGERATRLLSSLQADKLDFPREYPELVKYRSNRAGNPQSFDELAIDCNYSLMLENEKFINQLVGNSARYNGYIASINGQSALLQTLYDALARELDSSHE